MTYIKIYFHEIVSQPFKKDCRRFFLFLDNELMVSSKVVLPNFPQFSPNTGKHRPEIIRIWTLFTQWFWDFSMFLWLGFSVFSKNCTLKLFPIHYRVEKLRFLKSPWIKIYRKVFQAWYVIERGWSYLRLNYQSSRKKNVHIYITILWQSARNAVSKLK